MLTIAEAMLACVLHGSWRLLLRDCVRTGHRRVSCMVATATCSCKDWCSCSVVRSAGVHGMQYTFIAKKTSARSGQAPP